MIGCREKPTLCVLATHPIQYAAPWFRYLHGLDCLRLKVVYFREPEPLSQGVGFDRPVTWDIPLRGGYRSVVLDIPENWLQGLLSISKLWKVLTTFRPHALLVPGWNEPLLILACALARLRCIPVIMRAESNDLRPRNLLARSLHRLIFLFVSSVVQIGQANRRFYQKSGWADDRIHGGGYCVDNERLLAMHCEQVSKREMLRGRYGFRQEEFVFAFFGKHVAFKRPEMLIAACAICREDGVNSSLLIGGQGPLTDSLMTLAKNLNVPAFFTGFLNQTELWKVYLAADALVLPSTWQETWGLVANEAMLFGLPVIVSDEAGCAEDLIVEGRTGFTFSGGASDLAAVMKRMAGNIEQARTMGAAARERILAGYSFEVATSGLLAALTDVGINVRGDTVKPIQPG